jgi:glycosyltransferase involved in cell wall biosynthesis
MRVTHVITDMKVGGAQIMLQRLAERLEGCGVSNIIIALGHVSPRFEPLRRLGIPVSGLDMSPSVFSIGGAFRLRRLMLESRPDVVHTWTYHANLLGGLVGRTLGVAPVVWGLHHVPHRTERLKTSTRAIVRASGLLSSVVPERIVCCAQTSKLAHEALGYASRKMVVITNGFDTDTFRPDAGARVSVRRELGLPADARLVGLMARFHPQKDHQTFIRAAAHLSARLADVHFVLAGRDVNSRNTELLAWLAESHVRHRVHLLGNRDDMPRLMAACDVVCSAASVGEAFPLVLGEAMSCGVPCVTTDVGDSAALVGDTGRVVAPRDAVALANACASILTLAPDQSRRLGELARARIVDRYQLAACVRAYLSLYEELRHSTGTGART